MKSSSGYHQTQQRLKRLENIPIFVKDYGIKIYVAELNDSMDDGALRISPMDVEHLFIKSAL